MELVSSFEEAAEETEGDRSVFLQPTVIAKKANKAKAVLEKSSVGFFFIRLILMVKKIFLQQRWEIS
jgi:hypothetical protein